MKKYLTSLISSILILSVIPLTVSAQDVTYMDMTFNNGIVDSYAGPWNTIDENGSITTLDYTGQRANLSNGYMYIGTENLGSFATDFSLQKDFYLDINFSILSLKFSSRHTFISNMNSAIDFRFDYNPVTKKFEYILKHTDDTYTLNSFPDTFNLIEGQDYNVIFGRNGNELVLSVDGVEATPQSIVSDIEIDTLTTTFLGGQIQTGYSNFSLKDFKIVGGSPLVSEPILPDTPNTQETDLIVTGGELSFSTSNFSFDNILFDSDTVQKTTTSNPLFIKDDRASGAGWNIKVSATDFIATLSDPSGGSGNIVATFPSNYLEVKTGLIDLLSGQDINGISLYSNLILSDIGQTLMIANPGYGMGSYSTVLDFILTIPNTVTVTDVDSIGSNYFEGDIIGILEGKYTSTITYTIGTGL
jgi:hypothetical protein